MAKKITLIIPKLQQRLLMMIGSKPVIQVSFMSQNFIWSVEQKTLSSFQAKTYITWDIEAIVNEMDGFVPGKNVVFG